MSPEASKPAEFRRYRQAFTGAYLALAGSVPLWLAVSVVKELFFHRPKVAAAASLTAQAPDVDELLECHRMVLDLLTALGTEAASHVALPQLGDRGERPPSWEDFSRAWRDEWDLADARCRFSELAGTMGVDFDRVATVHRDLPSMRLQYESLLVRFDEEQAAELARMRRALDLSLEAFEAARDPAPTQPN